MYGITAFADPQAEVSAGARVSGQNVGGSSGAPQVSEPDAHEEAGGHGGGYGTGDGYGGYGEGDGAEGDGGYGE
ncbi:hypothetical protein, partial [Streptomyces ipomoeae]|uniref:hypothetical protein n=1 Tax=Streptomyces ipomoeae TaxID=103232 RepID=UPI0029B860C4